ncbi:unnamed protein product [Pieris macdunnoughi]|uniref:Uncharacterized protein n=1 Tax=Pieris macdunnoughi TaxID=345717 RepID=A0A821WHW5_9NEOP|nr:unnamed protein product [Pieris macdunnoughi]
MGAAYRPGRADCSGSVATEPLVERSPCVPRTVNGGQGGAGCAAMPVPDRQLGDEFAPPEPKRCRHCDGKAIQPITEGGIHRRQL